MAKKNSKQPKPDKVAIRREKEIKEAIECGNWKRVVHLLSLPLENAERRDRYHGKLSINFTYKKKEMLDFLPDNSRHSNPLESLIYEEDMKIIYQTIDEFDDIEQTIIFGYFFEDKKFTQLANMHFEKAIELFKSVDESEGIKEIEKLMT